MGIVYEAEQQQPKRPVALKVVHAAGPSDELRVRLFQREVQALARLKHPNIAPIFESGQTRDGRHFFAMELVRGETLRDSLARENARGGLSREQVRRRLELFRRVCDAVNYAHQRGIIHRDLKPTNILVPRLPGAPETGSAEVPEIKVMDFGLAYITDAAAAGASLVTSPGQVCGTVAYMSPEQIRGNPDEIDIRTDVYSLGVILFEMLTGQLPLDATRKSFPEAARIICETSPAPLARDWLGNRKPPAELQTIVSKALEKDPRRRYQSAAALSEDVERFLHDQPILARRPGALYQLRKMIARHKAVFAMSGALLVLVSAFAVLMAVLSARLAVERDRSAKEAARAGAINQFLFDTMGAADPIEGQARDITVLEALRHATRRIESSFADQPEVEAKLRQTIGVTYLRLGAYEDAEPMLRSAVERLSARADLDSSELIEPLNGLGVLRHERGDYAAAEALYRRAWALQGRHRLKPPGDEMGVLINLALVLQDQGKLDESERFYTEILESDRKRLGPGHVNVAIDLGNLGGLLRERGQLARCETLHREAVSILEAAGSAWLAIGLGNLGEAIHLDGRSEEAEPILARAVALGLAKFGEKNQDVAKVRVKRAECLLALGRPEQAESEATAAREVFHNSLGASDKWTRRAERALETSRRTARTPAR
jgi:tetratricopeptide (TPR) repeat protein